jgi:hypothetical protein
VTAPYCSTKAVLLLLLFVASVCDSAQACVQLVCLVRTAAAAVCLHSYMIVPLLHFRAEPVVLSLFALNFLYTAPIDTFHDNIYMRERSPLLLLLLLLLRHLQLTAMQITVLRLSPCTNVLLLLLLWLLLLLL